jgi:hypothetical protein
MGEHEVCKMMNVLDMTLVIPHPFPDSDATLSSAGRRALSFTSLLQ